MTAAIHWQWGTITSAVAAVGTLGALAFAIATLRREQLLDRRRQDVEERRQASQVVIWPSSQQDNGVCHTITIRNGSDLPIFDATLYLAVSPNEEVVLHYWR